MKRSFHGNPFLSMTSSSPFFYALARRRKGFIEVPFHSFRSPLLLSPPLLHWTRHRSLDRQAHQSDRHNRQRHQKSRKSQTKSSEAQRPAALHVTASPGSPGILPTLHSHQLKTIAFLYKSISEIIRAYPRSLRSELDSTEMPHLRLSERAGV